MAIIPSSRESGYIVPIDGLRALAVIAVLLFHVDFPWVKGGFTGVDVFFVISGFLITRNIVHVVDAGEWSAARFYLRRIARLFPALFATIAATLLASWWVLSPDDLARLGRTSMMAILSVGNIFFWLESGYFDSASASKPLLHTWSLAVEEQFYLVWPALMLILSKTGVWGRRVGVVVLILMSVLAARLLFSSDPAAVFFLTPFRVHQFGLGAVVALTALMPRNMLSSFVSFFGATSILAVAYFADGSGASYELNTIAPAVAATAVIASSRSVFAERVLGSFLPVWIGRRSYSIYLAHWPIIVLWKMKTDFEFSTGEQMLAVVISIAAGTLLYELVERPFRFRADQSPGFRGSVLAGIAALAAATLTIGGHYWGFDGVPSRQPTVIADLSSNMDARWDRRKKIVRRDICSFPISVAVASDYQPSICSNPPKGGKSYLVVGDSFANDAYMVLKQAYPDTYFGQLAVPGCWLRLPKQFPRGQQDECRKLYQLALEQLIRDDNYDGIVLSSNWQDGHYYRIDDLINYLRPLNKQIIVVGQRARFKDRLPSIVSTEITLEGAIRKAQGMVLDKERKINDTIKERFADKVDLVDFYSLQCPEKCLILDEGGALMYLDDSHLSVEGTAEIARRLKQVRPSLSAP